MLLPRFFDNSLARWFCVAKKMNFYGYAVEPGCSTPKFGLPATKDRKLLTRAKSKLLNGLPIRL